MKTSITFFPVGNGDMTLIKLNDELQTRILIDINIRSAADNPDDYTFDAADYLRKQLERDKLERLCINVFIQTHPDQDHLGGLINHFHLGDPANHDSVSDKILINEIWSSPIVWRRADRRTGNQLCKDALAFRDEARRRVNLYKQNRIIGKSGDRIRIIGEDENNKTHGLDLILTRVNEVITEIDGNKSNQLEVYVIGPLPHQPDEKDEDYLQKNRSSIILQWKIASRPGGPKNNYILMGGDAEVGIWKRLWKIHQNQPDFLKYDILLTPHHCSWHSLSNDSWSQTANPELDQDAVNALSQAFTRPFIISSSNPIKNDKQDPPCYGAKIEYESIANKVSGKFLCTSEEPSEISPEPIEIVLTQEGPKGGVKRAQRSTTVAATGAVSTPRPHG